jgi:hypothetical protein
LQSSTVMIHESVDKEDTFVMIIRLYHLAVRALSQLLACPALILTGFFKIPTVFLQSRGLYFVSFFRESVSLHYVNVLN